MNTGSKQRREALLGELESIRTLLGEDAQSYEDRELLQQASEIPLLIPEDRIPTLLPEDDAGSYIPVLSTVSADTTPTAQPATPAKQEAKNTETVLPTAPTPVADPLAAIRVAAAKVAAQAAARQRDNTPESETRSSTASPVPPTSHDREKLVDDIVRSALPRVELLLRELVQEALLQDKLRSGKR